MSRDPIVEQCVAAIAGSEPVGADPRAHGAYAALREEIAKLESPAAGPCRWAIVEREAMVVLTQVGKDLTSASYLAGALAQSRGLSGLTLGMQVLSAILEAHPNAYPTRARARSNALSWFVERAVSQVSAAKASEVDRPSVEALRGAARTMRAAFGERLGDDAPATQKLLESIERLALALPRAAEPAPASSPAPSPPPAAAPAPRPAPRPAPSIEAVDAPTDANGLMLFLDRTSVALLKAADALRAQRPDDPEWMRLRLTALLLPLAQAPQLANGNRTLLFPPPPQVRDDVIRLLRDRDRAALMSMLPSVLDKHRFWMDAHRALCQAMELSGGAWAPLAAAHALEIGALAKRLPALVQAEFADGTPFVSDESREWISSLASSSSTAPRPAADPAREEETKTLETLRERVKSGAAADALAMAHDRCQRAETGHARFLRRLELAALALDAGSTAVCVATCGDLYQEAIQQRLDSWDPPLTSRLCSLYLKAARAWEKTGAQAAHRAPEIVARLALVDPASALALTRA